MKLIVQIPCYNEEHTLPQTVADIPRQITGIDTVEILVIDDGSTDRTVEVAQKIGVDHIVRNKRNMGLARTFRRGLDACLKNGADIIVNTDGDNQYAGKDIPKLIRPILDGNADLVIGDRQTATIAHFSVMKKFLQRFGSSVVRKLSGVNVPDTVSGFRAISREAAIKLNIISIYSYTIEMIIQAGNKQMAVDHVPVDTNPKTRDSHLFKSIPQFIIHQLVSMIRMYAMYRPLRVFFYIGSTFSLIGLYPIFRFLYFYMIGSGAGHIQSLILGGAFLSMGFIAYLVGLLADLISRNRQLIELTLERVRKMELATFTATNDKEIKGNSKNDSSYKKD
jgi:glycosyltransferase involved in cell wall biosynthesis